jgi:uncharacterized protein (TIGR03435 family)
MILAKIIPAALGNHLWQSTLFAAAAALLALALRKNRAQTRYTLWLIASLKFLVPFALLIAAGAHLRWPAAAPIATPTFSVAVQQIGQPFTAPEISTSVLMPAVSNAWNPVITILFLIWFVGFTAVLLSWWRRWMRIRTIVRAASPLPLETSVPVLSSPTLLEPGVFGIFRPVLLLPEGITGHLSARHLESIFAHELCHVRRRDNLAAAIHMFVEALFWFHPLVWWIGARMMEERECACDEEVVRLGNQPQVYAESILKACQFYLESPLACVSGVTGSDLRKRIVRIMTQRVVHRLTFGRKLLLAAAGIMAIAVPILFGLVNTPQDQAQSKPARAASLLSFEVASIKRNNSGTSNISVNISPGGRFTARNITVKQLIEDAYDIQGFQVSGAPGWLDSARYDIVAKAADSSENDPRHLSESERKTFEQQHRSRLQSLLATRFHLKTYNTSKEGPVYALVVAKNGPKLQTAHGEEPNNRGMRMRPGQLEGQGVSISFLAQALSRQLSRTVVDSTGLAGIYDFTLKWTPDEPLSQMFKSARGGNEGTASASPSDPSGPSVFTAIQEQLGLKLQSEKAPVDVLVIEHVEKPSEN